MHVLWLEEYTHFHSKSCMTLSVKLIDQRFNPTVTYVHRLVDYYDTPSIAASVASVAARAIYWS